MKIIFFFLVFLLLGGFIIASNENLHLYYKEDREKFGRFYYSWLDSLFENFKGLGAYVVKSEWLPYNYTKNNISGAK